VHPLKPVLKTKQPLFNLAFGILSTLLVIFVILPLLSTILSTTPAVFWETVLDAEVMRSMSLTLGAAALATAIAAIGGLPLAYLLARKRFPGKQIVEAVVDLPVVIPHTAAGIALLMVFGSRGILGKFLAPLGIFFIDTTAGIVTAMLFVSLPFLVNASREAFALVEVELEQAAYVEGASPGGAFYHITLPIARRGVIAGLLMMWSRGISEFGAVVILAYHPKIVPVLIFERFEGFGLSAAQPVAALLIVVVFVIFGLLRFVVTRNDEN